MSQYSSFLATAPALQVLERTSSPESIRQFGNHPQLAKPWFIFRRPSETRYTPRKEVQQLEESHDDSITSVMSSTNPESILHEEIDCVATTAAEEVTAAEVPKIILYEQTDIRSSTDITTSEPSTNPGLIFKVSENSNTDIYYVTTTASEEITATEVPKIILYEQTDIRSSTDVTILGLSTNLEPISKVSECSNKHVNSVSDIIIFGPSTHPEPILKVSEHSSEDVDLISYIAILGLSTNLEPTFKVSECSSQPVDSVSDFAILGPATESELIGSISESSSEHVDFVLNISAEATHPRLFANPEHIPAVLHTDIDFIASTTSEEIIQYEQIDNCSSTDASIFELSTNPELSKRSNQHVDSVSDITVIRPSTILEPISKASKLPSQHVDSVSDISSAETTHLNISTNPESVSHANIDSVATAMSPDFILYEPIDIRSSTDVTIFEPSPHLELNQVSENSSQHVSDISSTKTTHLKLSTNPAPMSAVSHADIDCDATAMSPDFILYEQTDIRSATDATISKPSTSPKPIFKVPECSNQHVDSVSDISSAETIHLKHFTNPEHMPSASHPDINCVETILYEQIDSRSSADVTILGPSTIFKASESSSQHVDSVSDIAILGSSINLELIDSVSEHSSQNVDSVPPKTTYLKLSTNPDSMPAVSHVDNDSVATTTDEVITVKVPAIPEIILYEEIDIRSSTNVTIFGPYINPELVDCVSDIVSGDTTYLNVSTKLESMPEVCVATKTDAIPAVKISTSLGIMPYEPMEICFSTDHASYDIPPVKINSLTSAKTSEKLFDNNLSMQITALTPATKLELTHTVQALTRQKTERHSNASFSKPTPVARSSKFSNQDIDFGSNTTDNPKSKTIGIGRSNKLLESMRSKLIDPVRPISQSSGRPVQLAAIAANTSHPRSRSSLPTAPQVPQRPVTRPPPAKSTLPKKFGSSRFAGSILHLPTADEDEARRRHALISGKLARAPKVGISVRPPGPGIKRIPGGGKKAQERVGSNATLAVMTEVVEEEEEVAERNLIPAAEKREEKVEEKVVEEERGAAISRSLEITGAWPFSRSRNVRRKTIVWRKLDNIAEEECEADEPVALVAQCEPAAAAQKDLEEAPIVNGEEEGGVLVETPSREEMVEEVAEEYSGADIDPVETAPPRPIPYPTPSRWSSRIGEMRVTRKPSYGWETASQSCLDPMRVGRVRYPGPMRWSSRIGEVRAVRTLGYVSVDNAQSAELLPLATPAHEPEAEVLDTPEGAVTILGGGEFETGFPLFLCLAEEVTLVPEQAKSRESQGAGAKKTGSLRHRAKQAWKKIGRVLSGGRG